MGLLFGSEEIEEQINNYSLRFIQIRNSAIEWNISFPMFVDTFNKIIHETKRIPSQDEFVDRYFKDNEEELSKKISDSYGKTSLEARIRRTYPSLVRDIHFAALLTERGLNVIYERDTDVCAGVDHTIQYKGKTFQIHCYVNTRIGRMGRKIKNRRHDFSGIHLDIWKGSGHRIPSILRKRDL